MVTKLRHLSNYGDEMGTVFGPIKLLHGATYLSFCTVPKGTVPVCLLFQLYILYPSEGT